MLGVETILIFGVVLSVLTAAGMFYVVPPLTGKDDRTRRSLEIWTRAVVVQAVFWVLFTFAREAPVWVTVVLVNTLSVLAIAAYFHAVRVFFGLPERQVLLLLIVLIIAIGNFWFTYQQPSFDARVALVSLSGGGLMLWTAATLINQAGLAVAGILNRVTGTAIARAARLTAIVFLGSAGGLLLRLLDTVVHPGISAAESLAQQAALVVFAVMPITTSFGFLLLHAGRANARLRILAATDPLTGALNRRAFESFSDNIFASCQRLDRPVCALMLDIDHFKRVNDIHGHDVGDRALIAFHDCLVQCLRQEDVVARMGGEEFAVLLPGADEPGGVLVAERIRSSLRSIVDQGQLDGLDMTVSIGVAQYHFPGDNLADMLKRADKALYMAKRSGRDRVAAAEPTAETEQAPGSGGREPVTAE
ncbi:MAG: diguanylate cyclase [Wenzhouxiangella sp.]